MGLLLVGEDGGGGEDLGDVLSGVQCGAFREAGMKKAPTGRVPVGLCVVVVRGQGGERVTVSPLPGALVVRECQCDGT